MREFDKKFPTAGELLEHLGVHVEPKRVVERIPEGMAIPQLRERLVRIMHDFRTQASLREGCNTILSRDCTMLAQVGSYLFTFNFTLQTAAGDVIQGLGIDRQPEH